MQQVPLLEIVPLAGVGPVRFGDTRDTAKRLLSALPGALDGHSSHGKSDFYFRSALQIEYLPGEGATFMGASFYRGCGCSFSLFGIDPWRLPAQQLFELIKKRDGGDVPYSAYEALFRNLIVTLWDADEQYDAHGDETSAPFFAQVGVGSPAYLKAIAAYR